MRHEELFTCLCCGKEFWARRKDAKYCSYACSHRRDPNKLFKKEKPRKGLTAAEIAKGIFMCPHNNEVRCSMPMCGVCGWSPSVEQKRKEALYEGV